MQAIVESICRSEFCNRDDVHAEHDVKPPSSPKRERSGTPWRLTDTSGLMGAVAKATSKTRPTYFEALYRDVRDDYGSVSARSVHRYLEELIGRGHILAIDLDLPFKVYLRPRSPWLRDLVGLRELMADERGERIKRRHVAVISDKDFVVRDCRTGSLIDGNEFLEWLSNAEGGDDFVFSYDNHKLRAITRHDGDGHFVQCLTCDQALHLCSKNVVKTVQAHIEACHG